MPSTPSFDPASKTLRAIADDMTAEAKHGRRAAQQGFEPRLAFEQRQPHQILAVEMQQIEREIHQLGRRIPMPLQGRE